MLGSSKRPLSVVLLLAYLPQITGCHKTRKVEPAQVEPHHLEPVVGITRIGGAKVSFDGPGSLRADTVYGLVHGSSLAVPLDSVERVWVTRAGEVQRLKLSEVKSAGEHVIGATTKDGRELKFDKPGGLIKRDTVFASRFGQEFQLPMDEVQRLWIQRSDPAATALLVVGVLGGAFLATAAIYAATKESCPFVYSWDGTHYVFDAEPYGGAISRGLEREDYGRLEHLRPDHGTYKLLVTNEVNETQMTNSMELWVVDHPRGSRVVPDPQGGLHLISQTVAPSSARDRQGRELRGWLERTDRMIWEPLPVRTADGGTRQEIILTFPRLTGARNAGLVANVATGIWGSHMIRAMLQLRGREVGAWYDQIDQRSDSRDALIGWDMREELYHLRIEVEEPEGWRVRGLLPGGGPFIAEDRIIPLDLSRVEGDSVRLRIRPPLGFWALNSFALSYEGAAPVTVDTIAPMTAKDGNNRDVLAAIINNDDRYYPMPNTGDRGYVTFRAPAPRAGSDRTVLLHARGYYRLHLPESGDPDTAAVRRIVEVPGAAAEFAAEQFSRWQLAEH